MREVNETTCALFHGIQVVASSLVCLDMSVLALNGGWIGNVRLYSASDAVILVRTHLHEEGVIQANEGCRSILGLEPLLLGCSRASLEHTRTRKTLIASFRRG